MPRFPSTLWQDLDRARNGEAAGWNSVVERYRPAIVGFARGAGHSESDAEDIAQEVFLQVVRSRILDGAQPRKGRFRSLILAVTSNVMRHRWRDERAEKRGGGRKAVPLEGLEAPAPEEEDRFDREWVARLVAAALQDLAREHAAYHDALKLALQGTSQADIAKALRRTPAQANNHVHRARMWVRRRLKELVRESCADEATFGEELAWLGRYLDLAGD